MPRLKQIHQTVTSSWMGLEAGRCCLLVCTTEKNQYVVVNPVAGSEENPVTITAKNVHEVNILAAPEFPDPVVAIAAAQHAADAMQRRFITELSSSDTQH